MRPLNRSMPGAMDLDYIGNGTALENRPKGTQQSTTGDKVFIALINRMGTYCLIRQDGIVPLHCPQRRVSRHGSLDRRLVVSKFSEVSNDAQEKPLTAKGLLLIDEVDLHSPSESGKRELLSLLAKWLPNFQFRCNNALRPWPAQQAGEGGTSLFAA